MARTEFDTNEDDVVTEEELKVWYVWNNNFWLEILCKQHESCLTSEINLSIITIFVYIFFIRIDLEMKV